MSIVKRKLSTIVVLVSVVFLANISAVTEWLQAVGVVTLAQYFRSEYITGTALSVIVVLLLLVPATSVYAASVMRCPVCDTGLQRRGKYCPECGSRV